jgi:hypothetical protein
VQNGLGGSVAILLVGTRDDLFGSIPLPFDLLPIGMPGCKLYTNIVIILSGLTSGSQPGEGRASVPFPVPNDPSLRGGRILSQWLVLDLSANAAGFAASDAGAAVIR